MKHPYALFILLLSLALYTFSLFTLVHWSPTPAAGALAWNLGIALAPVLALFVQLKMARERGLSVSITLPVIAVMNTVMILGSRLGAWTAADWSLALSQGILPDTHGKTIIGGLLLAIALFWILKHWWKLPMDMADILMLGLPLAAVPARIGCYLAGCCYGMPTEANWGVCYGPETSAYTHYAALSGLDSSGAYTQPLYPVQLLMMAGNLLIFFILWQFRRHLSREGAIGMLCLALLSFQRFGLEFIRDVSTNRGELGRMVEGLKLVQWQSLFLAFAALGVFVYLQYFRPAVNREKSKTAEQLLWPQLLTLIAIIAGSYALGPAMTLDETAVVVLSCLPALFVLGRKAWAAGPFLQQRLAPLSFLSLGFVLLISDPVDSLRQNPEPAHWKHWFELSGGYSKGRVERKVIVHDCNGNEYTSYQHISNHFWGGTFSAHWQKNATQLSVTLLGTGGRYDSQESQQSIDNNRFLSLGGSARFDHELIGFSVGVIHTKRIYDPDAADDAHEASFLPLGSLRVGYMKKLSFDMALTETPMIGYSREPFARAGLRYGFNQTSGNTYLAGGVGAASTGTGLIYLGGGFPIWKNKIYGGMTVYAGSSSMFQVGLKYRFGPSEKQ